MKWMPCLLTALVFTTPLHSRAAQTAQVKMYCLSIKTGHGVDPVYGDEIDMYNTFDPNGAGELAPWIGYLPPGNSEIVLPGPDYYAANLSLYDATFDETYGGSLFAYVPDLFIDSNLNGLPDFFEVAKGISATSWNSQYGSFSMPGNPAVNYGQVKTRWTRTAGQKTGQLIINLQDYYQMVCPFDILEYTGTLTYTPGTTVSGSVNLVQTGNPASTLQGNVRFTKSDADPYNALGIVKGSWTDASAQTHSFTNHVFQRDPVYRNYYEGYVEFDDDFDFATPYPYYMWVLSIKDTNDSDGDGIPDFSDDATTPPQPRQPQLTLKLSGGSLQLTIAGDVNHVHEIQETTSLTNPNWQPVRSVTLTTDPQTETLALPSTARFWRVVAQ